MARRIDLEALLRGCAEGAFDAGIRIDTELVPLEAPDPETGPSPVVDIPRSDGWRRVRRFDLAAADRRQCVVNGQDAPGGVQTGAGECR